MVSFLYCKIMSRLGWYVDIGDLRCITYDRSLLNIFQEKEGGMSVDLGDDATITCDELAPCPSKFLRCCSLFE